MTIPVIDVFAGPGGLNEGFSALNGPFGTPTFQIRASFEMDPVACQTLRLRAALRITRNSDGAFPRTYFDFLRTQPHLDAFLASDSIRSAADKASADVLQIELGEKMRSISDDVIAKRVSAREDWVLVGGPPCQAYSLVGRARRSHDATFEDDHKHFLYREYLHILLTHRPAVFVMENVKGMLSATHGGTGMFARILQDLKGAGYEIRSLVVETGDHVPSDFIIQSEKYGVPQRRHRVILLGIRNDIKDRRSALLRQSTPVTVHEAIGDLRRVRSTISPARNDTAGEWAQIRDVALKIAKLNGANTDFDDSIPPVGGVFVPWQTLGPAGPYLGWTADPRIGGAVQHNPRSHMPKDLQRYAYLASMADAQTSPKLTDLPDELLPLHKNIGRPDTPFTDRFRVQVHGRPSTTVVSHISKDGHYFIHPDPMQMRSLTVREAARLQSFPDDYFFCGPRTQQFHQVGNAVPPFLARQIAEIVADFLA